MNRTQQANKNVSMLAGVIVMAVVAVGLGYLLGNWMIGLVAGPGSGLDQVTGTEIGSDIVVSDPGAGPVQVSVPTTNVPESNFTPNTEQQEGLYIVQFGSFSTQGNAQRLREELMGKGYLNVNVTDGPPFKVQVLAGKTRSEADSMKTQARNDGYVDVFTVHQ